MYLLKPPQTRAEGEVFLPRRGAQLLQDAQRLPEHSACEASLPEPPLLSLKVSSTQGPAVLLHEEQELLGGVRVRARFSRWSSVLVSEL